MKHDIDTIIGQYLTQQLESNQKLSYKKIPDYVSMIRVFKVQNVTALNI